MGDARFPPAIGNVVWTNSNRRTAATVIRRILLWLQSWFNTGTVAVPQCGTRTPQRGGATDEAIEPTHKCGENVFRPDAKALAIEYRRQFQAQPALVGMLIHRDVVQAHYPLF